MEKKFEEELIIFFSVSFRYLLLKETKNFNKEDFYRALSTLKKLSTLSWKDIIFHKKQGCHSVQLNALKSKKILNHYEASEKEETSKISKCLISFKSTQKSRLLGFRKSSVFFLVFIDKNHCYC